MATHLICSLVVVLYVLQPSNFAAAQTNSCSLVTCNNGGSCRITTENQPICQCVDGYTGSQCESKANSWLTWVIISAVIIGILIVALIIGCVVLYMMRRRRKYREIERTRIIDRTNYLTDSYPKHGYNSYTHVSRAHTEPIYPARLEVPSTHYSGRSLDRGYVRRAPPITYGYANTLPVRPQQIAQPIAPVQPIAPAQPIAHTSAPGIGQLPPGKVFMPTGPHIDAGPHAQHIGYIIG